MSQLSAQRAFLFTIFSLLVIYAAWLTSIAHSSVSKISARHAFSSLTSPQSTKVAVPFGVRDSLLLSAVQALDRNVTASSEGVQGSRISKRALPSWYVLSLPHEGFNLPLSHALAIWTQISRRHKFMSCIWVFDIYEIHIRNHDVGKRHKRARRM